MNNNELIFKNNNYWREIVAVGTTMPTLIKIIYKKENQLFKIIIYL